MNMEEGRWLVEMGMFKVWSQLEERPALLEQVQGVGTSNCLGAALDAQFPIDVVDMAFHGADADDEFARHHSIWQASHQEP